MSDCANKENGIQEVAGSDRVANRGTFERFMPLRIESRTKARAPTADTYAHNNDEFLQGDSHYRYGFCGSEPIKSAAPIQSKPDVTGVAPRLGSYPNPDRLPRYVPSALAWRNQGGAVVHSLETLRVPCSVKKPWISYYRSVCTGGKEIIYFAY